MTSFQMSDRVRVVSYFESYNPDVPNKGDVGTVINPNVPGGFIRVRLDRIPNNLLVFSCKEIEHIKTEQGAVTIATTKEATVAKAMKTIQTEIREVTTTTEVKTPVITLTLSEDEAVMILDVMGQICGNGFKSRRGLADNVGYALFGAGVKYSRKGDMRKGSQHIWFENSEES